MVKHDALIRYDAFKTLNIKIGFLLEHFCAVWTAAEGNFLVGDLQLDGRLWWLFGQTGWAYNHILRLLKVFLGISDE